MLSPLRCIIARTPWERFRGGIGRPPLAPDAAMVFPRTARVHTFFVRTPIDVVCCDGIGRVLAIISRLKPWRIGPCVRGTAMIIEFAGGGASARGIRVGDIIEIPWSM